MDTTKITNVRVDGIDPKDYPDFTDAFIDSADYDGEEMADEQLDEINEDYDFVYESLMNQLY